MSGDDDLIDSKFDDREASPDEIREAAELARALERGTADEAPDDALQTAALLRYGTDAELDDRRAEDILDELLRSVPAREPSPRPGWRRWLWAAGGAVGLAAAIGIFIASRESDRATLPAPDLSLLQAQAAAARPGGDEAYAQELAAYRRGMLRAMQERYGR